MISIIIPVYNQAEKLRGCLESIFNQTIISKDIFALEIIIVNDGSTDNIEQVINDMKNISFSKSLRFVYRAQKNQGANPARNRGAEDAGGEFMIFCDADIIMEPEMLEKMLSELNKNPNKSFVYSSYLWGAKKFRLWNYDENKLKEMPYIHTTSLLRKEHFPGFDNSIKRLQDWDLWLTMLEQGHTGIWIDEVLFKVNTGGTMSSWLPKIAYKILPFLPKVKKYKIAVAAIKDKHKLTKTE
jgi:glycosyltransferase involved in cell wall biosynthesis